MQTQQADYARGSTRTNRPQTSKKSSGRNQFLNWQWPKPRFNFWQQSLLILLPILCALGLFFVFEASTAESFQMVGHSYYFLTQQTKWMFLGWSVFGLGWLWPIKFWQKTAVWWYLVAMVSLVLVFIPGIGLALNGAHRWLSIGGLQAQPAEFLKFATLIFFASWLSKHQRLGAFLMFSSLPTFLVLMQPDLGSLLIVLSLMLGLYFVANGNLVKLLPIMVVGLLGLIVVIVTSPYRLARVTTYLNPEADPLGKGFHIRQVTLGLGNGGWFGQGLGNSTQKYLYIPEASSDSIFAIVGEELGFVGAILILGLFLSLVLVIFKLGRELPPQSFERLVAQGIGIWVGSQVFLNLAAVVALVPLTGIPLPFFSYGGSSLLMLFFIMGLLLQLSQIKSEKT
ncbi:MAG TPA: hypothetical protein DEP87_03445 [Candidatus Pacebacteria bacterium]|nr:hypothetical protein [Candidatus Paceibacterota bacterium]